MLKGQAKKDYQREYMRSYMRKKRLGLNIGSKQGLNIKDIPTKYRDAPKSFRIPDIEFKNGWLEGDGQQYDSDGNPIYEY